MQLRKYSLLWDAEVFILKIYILDWREKKIHLSFLGGEDWELGLGTAWPSGSELDRWNRRPPGKKGELLLFCGTVLFWWSLLSVFGGVCKNTGVGCHFLLQCMKVKSESEVAQSCPTLSDPMDCGLPGPSIHGIFQARVLELVASAFSQLII